MDPSSQDSTAPASKKRLQEKQQRREDLENEEEEEEGSTETVQNHKASDEVLAKRKIVRARRSQATSSSIPESSVTPKISLAPFVPQEPAVQSLPQEEKTDVGTFTILSKSDAPAPTAAQPTAFPKLFSSMTPSAFTFDTKFSFSSSPFGASSSPTSGTFAGPSAFGQAPQKKEDSDEETGEEEKVDEKPTLAESSNTGEEDEDNLLQLKGKLYVWDSEKKTWRERGAGICRLNTAKDKSYTRLIFREQAVRRVLLNFRLFSSLTIKTQNKATVTFIAPSCEEPSRPSPFLLKVIEKPPEPVVKKLIDLINEHKPK